MDYGPQVWIKSYRQHEDGSMECRCYWCNEPMLFFGHDTIAVVQTKQGEFGGLQCQQCVKDYAGRHAIYPVKQPLPNNLSFEPQEPKQFLVNGDGSVEWQCLQCKEPILIYKGDSMVVVVGDHGVVDGILCNHCAKPENRKA